MRRKLLAPAALAGVLLIASHAWAPPPSGGGGARPPVGGGGSRPPVGGGTGSRPPTGSGSGSTGVRPPIGSAKPAFNKTFETARAKSATEAAAVLRTQGAFLARTERAAMLSLLTHQMLRQQQTASLADLRRLRSDWVAIGPGAGLDPIVAMQLEAAESAAERLLLAEVLKLIAEGQYASADAKLAALESPRYLPAAVIQSLPDLRKELHRAGPFARVRAELQKPQSSFREVWSPVMDLPRKSLPHAMVFAAGAWSALETVRAMFGYNLPGADDTYNPADFEQALKEIAAIVSAELAGKIRVEMAARLFLTGRAKDAVTLLEGEVDPLHAAAVLADLRAVALGGGEITTPQVAKFVSIDGTAPAYAVAILPPDQAAKWKSPARKPGETTVDVAIGGARQQLKAAVDAAVDDSTGKVNAAADRVRAALAAEAAPLKAFLEMVEALRGKSLDSPVERQLAATAGTRGLTVAETVGVLAAESDRPAAAARLLATVPAFTTPAAFAATVEVAGRAPAAFAAHPDAGFKLTGIRDRARVRDAVGAVLDAHAAKAAAGQEPPAPGRAALEAEVAKRLGPAAAALNPEEFVQGLFDVCRDWADDHARLSDAMRELNEFIAGANAGERPGERRVSRPGEAGDAERDEFVTLAQVRRLSVQAERKRREVGVTSACQLLGAYGTAAKPAAEWLVSQGEDKPWCGIARLNFARINEGK